MRRTNIPYETNETSVHDGEPIVASKLLERIGMTLLTSAVGAMGLMAFMGRGL
jgi:hypothetical protein